MLRGGQPHACPPPSRCTSHLQQRPADDAVLSTGRGAARWGALVPSGFHSHRSAATALALDGLGSGFFTPFALLYFPAIGAMSYPTAGLAYGVCSLLSVPFGFLAGAIADRTSPALVVTIANLVRFPAYLLMIFCGGLPWLAWCLILCTSLADRAYWSSQAPLIASFDPSPEAINTWNAAIGALRNTGLALGGAVGGLVIQAGRPLIDALPVINALSFLAAGALLLTECKKPTRSHASREPPRHVSTPGPSWWAAAKDPSYLALAVCKLFIVVCTTMYLSLLTLYLIKVLQAPGIWAGIAYAVVMIGSAVLQPVFAHPRHGLTRGLQTGIIALIAVAVLGLAPSSLITVATAVGVGAFTIAQAKTGPPSDSLSVVLAPPTARGQYQAFYQLAWTLGLAIAPILGTRALSAGRDTFWIIFALTGAAALISAAVMTRISRSLETTSK